MYVCKEKGGEQRIARHIIAVSSDCVTLSLEMLEHFKDRR